MARGWAFVRVLPFKAGERNPSKKAARVSDARDQHRALGAGGGLKALGLVFDLFSGQHGGGVTETTDGEDAKVARGIASSASKNWDTRKIVHHLG